MEDEPNTNNEPITKDQLQILNDILGFYHKDESTIECCEITMYCHIHSIDIVDELAIYNYLYGVQENICFHTERETSQTPSPSTSPSNKSSKRRMSEFSNSILNIENMLYEPSTSTDDELSQPPSLPTSPSNVKHNHPRLPSF